MNDPICIVPAAGRGSRWAPVSGYLPKEMLPLIDKPVIEWVIDEIVSAGYKNVVVVINSKKLQIKKYLVNHKYFKKNVNFIFINQEEPKGIAHAIYLSRKHLQGSEFGLALPDLPTIAHTPAMKQMMQMYKQTKVSHLVSLDRFPPATRHLYGKCLLKEEEKLSTVLHFCPKTNLKEHKHDTPLRMSGRFILNCSIIPLIEKLVKNQEKDEVTDVDALKSAINAGHTISGLTILGRTYDTGTPTGYVRANTAFFKKSLQKQQEA